MEARKLEAQPADSNDMKSVVDALNRVQAVIEFELDGTILSANDNFLQTLGYSLHEIQGKHHRIFCDTSFSNSLNYRQLWDKLARGEYESGEFKRVRRDGREIWIQASYNPVFNAQGRPYKVIKFATDVTATKMKNAEYEGKVSAISKSQAVIEFNLDGSIITANPNFLATVGYSISDIENKHHRMFCDPAYAASPAYNEFWSKLNRGEYDSGQYQRFGRGGKSIWIQATYNPICDMNGKPYKVVKFATDITAQYELEQSVKRKAESDRKKVDGLLKIVSRAAAGELTVEIPIEGAEPIDQLAGGIKQMVQDLRGVISKVVGSANSFTGSSREIADRSTTVATGAQALGATTEEMNATIEELTASINSIAENGKNADSLAKTTQKEAEIGAKSIAKSVEAMDLINKSSEDISE
ncbi:MAG: PAS domain S-box protein, partial [Proteobacteria bacterium]